MTESQDDQDPVDAIAEEFASRLRDGEKPDIAEYRARYPEHADAIDDLFPTLELMESLKPNSVPTSGSGGPVSGGLAVEQFGEYRIVRELGRGGMGIVYEALQESLDRRVALKVLPASVLYSPNKLERFQREARAVAQLHHTNIVPVYGVGEEDGTHYFVMQHIEGRSIDVIIRELRDAGGVPAELEELPGLSYPQAVARIGHQVADALAHAHAHGTLHRDIKPANLILDHEGNVWVADFGLAKMEESEDLTHSGSVLGTLRYSAPEQIEGHSSTSSDLYALGMTLYELLNLGPAFPETEQRRLLQRILHDEPPPLRGSYPELPVDLETVVLKCLAKDPADRYPTAEALADDLERVRIGVPIHARRVSTAERLVRWCRRNRAVAGALIVALLGLSIGAASGWTAFVQTRDALQRESENVELSVSALREIFDSLAPDDRAGAGGTAAAPERRGDRPARREANRAVAENQEVQVLTSILDFYDRFSAKNETDVELRREAARAYRRVCDLYLRRDQIDSARAAGERSRAILAQLGQEHPNDETIQLDIAETACELACCALETEEPFLDLSSAVEVAQKIKADSSTEGRRQRAAAIHARLLGLRGLGQLELEQPAAAIPDLKAACDHYRAVDRSHPRVRRAFATYTLGLAKAYTGAKRAEDAVALIEDEFLGPGERPGRLGDPETMSEAHQALSDAFRELGDLQRAARHERLARRRPDQRDGRPPPRRGPGGRPRGPGTP